MVVWDTGPIVAMANEQDRHHARCVDLPETGDVGQFQAALRAFAADAISVDEFSMHVYRLIPPWHEQDATQQAATVLINDLGPRQ